MARTLRHPVEPTLTYTQRLWLATVLVVLTLVILLVGCAGLPLAGDVPSRMDPSVAKLVKTENGQLAGYCTVFKVGTELAMTAGHCCGLDDETKEAYDLLGVEPTEVFTYHALGPHAVPGAQFEVLYDDDKHDVCVLRGKMHGAPLALASHDPELGAKVWTAGYPKTELLFSEGLWSGREEGEGGDAKASIAVWGGASGSPVMDQDGRVVGILRAFYPPMSNFALIAPIEWLRAGYITAKR